MNTHRATFRPRMRPCLLHGVCSPCRSCALPVISIRLKLTCRSASERSEYPDNLFSPAIWTARRRHRGHRSRRAPQIETWYRAATGPQISPDDFLQMFRQPGESRGIIPCVVRLRNSVGTTAVKSPDQMRDVAQIGCDQPRVIRVEDPAGKLRRLRKPKLRRLSDRA